MVLVADSIVAVLAGIVISFSKQMGLELHRLSLIRVVLKPRFFILRFFLLGIVLSVLSIILCFIAWEKLSVEKIEESMLTKVRNGQRGMEEIATKFQRISSKNEKRISSIQFYLRNSRRLALVSPSVLLILVLLFLFM